MEKRTKYIFSPYEKKIAVVTKDVWEKMRAIAIEMDIDNGGLYDARLGAINIWASPEDHPKDWMFGFNRGLLKYPREYLATIFAYFINDNQVELYLTITNYARLEYAKFLLEHTNDAMFNLQKLVDLATKGTDEEWRWAEEKARYLIAQAEAEKNIQEIIYCPFCGQEFPELKLFNDFIAHITTHVKVKSIVLSTDGYHIETEKGTLTPKDYTKERILK